MGGLLKLQSRGVETLIIEGLCPERLRRLSSPVHLIQIDQSLTLMTS